jgi:hypothetical protein
MSVCRRSLGETASATLSAAARASSGVGAWRNERLSRAARSTSPRFGGKTATSTPRITPAIVGWIPDSNIATHSANPETRYAGPRQIRTRFTTSTIGTSATAMPRASRSMSLL